MEYDGGMVTLAVCHVQVLVDMTERRVTFQVRDHTSPPVALPKVGSVFPLMYFYLGGPQNSDKYPLVQLVTEATGGSPSGPTNAATLPVNFVVQPPGEHSPFETTDQPLHSLKRKKPDSERPETRVVGYAYAVDAPGIRDGDHIYRFEGLGNLSTVVGLVTSDVVTGGLMKGPSTTWEGKMILTVQGCGQVYVSTPSGGRRRISYDQATQPFRKEEKLEVKVSLATGTSDLELLREGKPIYSFPHLGRLLPPGVVLHPFVGLLLPESSVTLDHKLYMATNDEDTLRQWAVSALRLTENEPMDMALAALKDIPTETLLTSLNDPAHGGYDVVDILREVRGRGDKLGTENTEKVVAGVIKVLETRQESTVWTEGLGLLASDLCTRDLSLFLDYDPIPLLLRDPVTVVGFTLLEQIITIGDRVKAYLLTQLPRLVDALRGDTPASVKSKALDIIISLLDEAGEFYPGATILFTENLIQTMVPNILNRLMMVKDNTSSMATLRVLCHVLTLTFHPSDYPGPQMRIQNLSLARPPLVKPYALGNTSESSTPSHAPSSSPWQATLFEYWQGYVGLHGGRPPKTWAEAAFYALQSEDVAGLTALTSVSLYAPLIAERAAFVDHGPWTGVISDTVLPCTVMAAYEHMVEVELIKDPKGDIKEVLLQRARAYLELKTEYEEKHAGKKNEPPRPFVKYPTASGKVRQIEKRVDFAKPCKSCSLSGCE